METADISIKYADEFLSPVYLSVEIPSLLANGQTGALGFTDTVSFMAADSVWATLFEGPLTRIEATTNNVVKQWIGKGGDSLRLGFHSLWITDYKKGLLFRILERQVLSGD